MTAADRPANGESTNLAEALQQEITRVRDEILPLYLAIGPSGMFGVMMIQNDLNAAMRALAESDVIACLRLYNTLKENRG